MEHSNEINQILLSSAKKIIAVNKKPDTMYRFIMDRMLNTFCYEIRKKGGKDENAFSTLWCMMSEIAMPLMRNDKDTLKDLMSGIGDQWFACRPMDFHESLVNILTAMKACDEFEEDLKEGFDILVTIADAIKELNIQDKIQRAECKAA